MVSFEQMGPGWHLVCHLFLEMTITEDKLKMCFNFKKFLILFTLSIQTDRPEQTV